LFLHGVVEAADMLPLLKSDPVQRSRHAHRL
jgi:hypothetical protein